MATNQVNKYIWLVDTIHRAGKISFEEINKKWLRNDMSEGLEIPKRTFHKWRNAIEEMLALLSKMRIAGSTAISLKTRRKSQRINLAHG